MLNYNTPPAFFLGEKWGCGMLIPCLLSFVILSFVIRLTKTRMA